MKNNILILLLLFIASISYGQRAITQQIIGVDEFVPYVGAAQDVDLGNFDLSGDTLKMNGVSLYSIISDSVQTAIIDSLTYSNDTLTVIEGGVNHKVEIISGGSTDYISNVTEASNNITFTGVGSAFNGSIGSIAKTDVANAFSLSAAGFAMDLFNSNGSGSGFRVRGNNIALSVNNGSAVERFRVEGDGDIFALNLSAGTKTNVVYIDPSTKELFEGAAPGGGDVSASGTPTDGQIAIWTDATTIKGLDNLITLSDDVIGTASGSGRTLVLSNYGSAETTTMTANFTLNLWDVSQGQFGVILMRQDATGSRTLTVNAYSDSGSTGLTEDFSGTLNSAANSYTAIEYKRLGPIVLIKYVQY